MSDPSKLIRVGDIGIAECPLSPSGHVLIAQFSHSARSNGRFVESGARIVVVGGDHGGLLVDIWQESIDYSQMDCFGDVVHASFSELIHSRAAREAEEEQAWLDARLETLMKWSLVLAVVFALLGVALANPVSELTSIAGAVKWICITLGATVWGVLVVFGIEKVYRRFDRDMCKLTLVSSMTALAGSTWGWAIAIPSAGILHGSFAGITAALLLTLPVAIFGAVAIARSN